MVYTLRFFSSKCSLFHNSNVFVSCIIHIYIQDVLKLKKSISGPKRLRLVELANRLYFVPYLFMPLSRSVISEV